MNAKEYEAERDDGDQQKQSRYDHQDVSVAGGRDENGQIVCGSRVKRGRHKFLQSRPLPGVLRTRLTLGGSGV
jgi:hypothetical protein